MRVAYLLPTPKPPRPELDATVRGVQRLVERFPGPLEFLYPSRRYLPFVSRSLAGMHRATDLRALDREVDLHLLVSDRLRPYPFLRRLDKPLAYLLVTGIDRRRPPWPRPAFRAPWRLMVPSEADRDVLEGWGFRRPAVVAAGVDLARFDRTEPPDGDEFVLLAGSAPWTRRQLHTKGVEHLLRAAAAIPQLRLVFLWRGAIEEEMVDLVRRHGLGRRVEIVNRTVDVNRVLARVHAATVLARSSKLVKAYPDSLVEALAAGRPLLVSRALRMAGFVERHGCGEVVDALDAGEVTAAVRRLIAAYGERRAAALETPLEGFSLESWVDAHAAVFSDLVAAAGARAGAN